MKYKILVGLLEQILAELKIVRKAAEPAGESTELAHVKHWMDNIHIWFAGHKLKNGVDFFLKIDTPKVVMVSSVRFGEHKRWKIRNDNDFQVKFVWEDNTVYVHPRTVIERNPINV